MRVRPAEIPGAQKRNCCLLYSRTNYFIFRELPDFLPQDTGRDSGGITVDIWRQSA
jgi:hypothetical protein